MFCKMSNWVVYFLLQHLEDENSHLRLELESQDGLIRNAEQSMKQHKHQLAQMEESVALKEDMIR